jgi:hypothetical protein
MDTNQEASGSPEPTELDPVANPIEANPSQATAAEGDGDQPQEQAEQQEAKPPKTFSQEEVDALIQKRLTKEARRSERLMAQKLAEMQSQQKPSTKPEPKREDFADDEAHQRAQIDHVVEQRAQERAVQLVQQTQQQQRQQSAVTQFWERADELAERYPDFEAVVTNPNVPLNGPILEFVTESEVGPELAYHLGKNRTKALSIAQMTPIQAARALMTLESELKAKPKAQPSRAPDPMNPVGNRGSASRSSMPSDDDDVDTWRQKEIERMKKAGLIR